jgi:hypothetical protein
MFRLKSLNILGMTDRVPIAVFVAVADLRPERRQHCGNSPINMNWENMAVNFMCS